VEKKQYDLCFEILRRFHSAGILNNFILIGSWCVYFYKDYFYGVAGSDHLALRTRDIDFLIENPKKIIQKVDLPDLLKDLGFVIDFKGERGYMKLDHPDLILEFLVPEKGRGDNGPRKIPALGINATALRFLELLSNNVIKVKTDGLILTMPHPANFALHKLIVAQRRVKKEKSIKDMEAAVKVLRMLIEKGEKDIITKTFTLISPKWQKKIIEVLVANDQVDLAAILK